MPEDKTTNGKNDKSVGLVERLKAGVKEDLESLRTDLRAKAREQVELLKKPSKTQVFTSIFRHKHDDTPRNRALGVLSNVFLHLHPAKINRDAVRYSYTWGMGGITFYLFIVLTLTGVLLMFYYHPSKVQAFRDVLYLEHDVPFRTCEARRQSPVSALPNYSCYATIWRRERRVRGTAHHGMPALCWGGSKTSTAHR